ncbi:MAG: ferritin [Clostridiales bacterium]|nr:ferritin [Clostridiales bacterium]
MVISEKMAKALSEQVNAELYSAYLYLSMSAYAEDAGLNGIANWLYVQSQEEMAHSIHMYQYILDRGAIPALAAIDAPDTDFSGIDDIFKRVLAHEEIVTARINAIATLAMQENDHAGYQFIMWYVNEQVEEESDAGDIVSRVELIGEDKGKLLNLDTELGARVFVNPFPGDKKLNGGAGAGL